MYTEKISFLFYSILISIDLMLTRQPPFELIQDNFSLYKMHTIKLKIFEDRIENISVKNITKFGVHIIQNQESWILAHTCEKRKYFDFC